jgi:hypothetical protein
VNLKLASLFVLASLIGGVVAGCASNAQIVAMGHNTYSITRQAVTAFSWNAQELKSEVRDEAAEFCAAKGKQLKVVELTAQKPGEGNGFAKARIVFQAVDAPVEGSRAANAPDSRASNAPDSVDRLYSDLKKLNELRQEKILTNEEFQGQKQKVLDQAK